MDYNIQFIKNALRYRNKPVFEFPDRSVSLSHIAIRDHSHRIACYLLHLGIQKGDSVCLWMGNVPEFPLIAAACLRIGAVVVPLNVYETAENIASMCRECGGKILFADGSNKYIRKKTLPDVHSDLPIVNLGDFESAHSLRLGFLPADLPHAKIRCKLQRSDPAFLLYTSGSTGEKKAVLKSLGSLSHFQRIDRLLITFVHYFFFPCTAFSLSPWFHLAGLGYLFRVFDGTEFSVISMDHFNPRSASDYLQHHKVSLWVGTATMLSRCCSCAGSSFELPRIILTSGEALSRRVLDILESQRGCQAMFSIYGTTEIGGIALMYYVFPDTPRLFFFVRSCLQAAHTISQSYSYKDFPADTQTLLLGDIIPTVQVAIYDEDRGCTVPDGEIGEIFVRSDTAARRYEYTRENKLCMELNGQIYTRTGDMGCKRGNQLYLVGRKKNLIIRSGENIIPAEIEQAAACYPGVLNAVVCGIPSSTHGEDICLCLETESTSIDIAALLEYLKNTLPKYMIPQHIDILTELPIGPTGKTNVQAIRAMMEKNYPAI